MRTPRAGRSTAHLKLAAILLGLAACDVSAAPDFSGVWGMVQHDRLGAPFFIPIEPKLNETGRAATEAFVAKYDVKNLEANGSCVEPGMPTVMSGIGGAAMEIVQQPERITPVQGGEPGIITLNMHYATFAPLDGPPPVAKTLGPQGTAAFLARGAGLISQLDQSILRRVADLSF